VERFKRKIQVGGREVEATPLSFTAAGENWNEYLLNDGTVLRAKLVATEILRVDGEYDPEGNPLYLLKASNVIAASVPENLRRKG
jgi:hypothetical protein